MRAGGKLVVDQLVVHGVDVAFGVPGESYLAVLDALHDAPIRFVACRHEVGAANMADAYGKLTGRPGICMVTRGPGATHAAGGVHTAFQDSTPMILLIGQVGRGMMEREAFQEIDYRQMFGPMAKWVAQIDDADRIPELVSLHPSMSRPPGDRDRSCSPSRKTCSSTSREAADALPYEITATHPAAEDLELRARAVLARAERPLVVVGGAPWSAEANRALTAWCTGELASRSLPGGAARTTSTTARRSTQGISGSALTPGSRSGSGRPTFSS